MDIETVPVWDLNGNDTGERINTGLLFKSPFRPDLIKRAVLSSRRNRQIVYGVDPQAGKRTSAKSWGPGRGMARVPRTQGSRTHSANRGAFAPFMVGGRRTHPPEADQNFTEKINKKEKFLALTSAIAATVNPILVESRGHIIDEVEKEVKYLPLVVVDDFENLSKTKDVEEVFEKLGLGSDIRKAKRRQTKVRAGKGKSRGRKYQNSKSVLVVVSNNEKLIRSTRNITGVDIVTPSELNVELLAPGSHAGRLTLWTKSAIEEMKSRFSKKV